MTAGNGGVPALKALAAALDRQAWVTVLTTSGVAQPARLHVASRRVPGLASDVYAEMGWYWWPHAERIGRTAAPSQAAATIAGVLVGDAASGPAGVAGAEGRGGGPGGLPQRLRPGHPVQAAVRL